MSGRMAAVFCFLIRDGREESEMLCYQIFVLLVKQHTVIRAEDVAQ
jgi:hypothetical protein